MKLDFFNRYLVVAIIMFSSSMCTPPNTDEAETSEAKEENSAGLPEAVGPTEVSPEAAASCLEAFSDGRYGISNVQAPFAIELVPGKIKVASGKGEGEPVQEFSGLGVALKPKDGVYWDDPRYSASGYDMVENTATNKSGGIAPFTVLEISPPSFAKNFEFLASETALFVKPASGVDYVLLSFNETNTPSIAKTINAAEFTPGQWLEIADVKPSSFKVAQRYALITAEEYGKTVSKTSGDLNVKLTAVTNGACFAKLTSPVQEATLFQAQKQYTYPPGHWINRYSKSHEFPTATLDDGGILIMWQGQSTASIHLTILSAEGEFLSQKMPVAN